MPSVFPSGTHHIIGISKLVYLCISVSKLAQKYDLKRLSSRKEEPVRRNRASYLNWFILFIRDMIRLPVDQGENHEEDEAAANKQGDGHRFETIVDCGENHQLDEAAAKEHVDCWENQQEDHEEAVNKNVQSEFETIVDCGENHQLDKAAAKEQVDRWKNQEDDHAEAIKEGVQSEFETIVDCEENHQLDEAAAKEQVDPRENQQDDHEDTVNEVDCGENHQLDEAAVKEQADRLENQQRDHEEAVNEGGQSESETIEQEDGIMFMAAVFLWICSQIMMTFLLSLARLITKLVKFMVGYEYYVRLRHKKERCIWSVEVMNELLECNSEYPFEQRQIGPQPRKQKYKNSAYGKNSADETSPTATTNKALESPLLVAAKHGVVEMVERILDKHPQAIFDVNAEKKNIVMIAVEHRQPGLYDFLHDNWRMMKTMLGDVDKDGNSVLHIAAKLGDGQRPWRIRGAALQMHMEAKWYKFVKQSMPPGFFVRYNNGHQTPKEIFQKTHRDLIEEGRQWLTSSAQSCSVVAALIATVAFATSATVPGGLKQDNGAPTLENKPIFIISAGSSLIALSSSMIAVVMFLGILTSSFRLKDFRKDLPRKLLLGLVSLLVSIVSMLVSFFAGHHFVLREEFKRSAALVYAAMCLPLVVFIIAKFPLDLDIMSTTLNKKPRK